MDRFVVEAERRLVGIAVRLAGGFRFVASDPDFHIVDRKVFLRARLLVRRVAELGRAPLPLDRALLDCWWKVEGCRLGSLRRTARRRSGSRQTRFGQNPDPRHGLAA